MNRRRLMVISLAVAATYLLVVFLNKDRRNLIHQAEAIGAEPKAQKALVRVEEHGISHKTTSDCHVGAYREMQSGDVKAFYGVYVGDGNILPLEVAQDLVQFYDKFNKQNNSKSKEINSSRIIWEGACTNGNTFRVIRQLNEEQRDSWWHGNVAKNFILDLKFNDEFIIAVKAVIEDCRTLKAVPFSVTP